MSLPKEPRQQMINMMYLVLTAMLAMNITKEVLTAFTTINASIENSSNTIIGKNDDFYKSFDEAQQTADSAKVRPYNEKAKLIKAESEKLYAYLQNWKDTVINRSGGMEIENGIKSIKGMDDINVSTELFVEQKKGDEVRKRLEDYVNFILERVDSAKDKARLKASMPVKFVSLPKTDDNPSGDWAFGTFHNIPVVAAVAMFSKYQNDVKNTESMALDYLASQVYLQDNKFDALVAIATPNTTYALEGQEITASIVLGAYNKSANPIMTSNAGAVQVKDGVGTLKIRASGAGVRTVNGKISVETNGRTESYDYKFDYTVGSAGASLQLDKMNVMYIGVDNPITLSASGYNIEDVKLNMPWAQLKSTGKGTYTARVEKQGTYDWSISASKAGTTAGNVGAGKIRVKYIPAPQARVGNIQSGRLKAGDAKAQLGVIAILEGFDFEARFQVTSFNFVYIPRNGEGYGEEPVTGPSFTPAVKAYMQRSKPGDKWVFENVKAKGPDGRIQPINTVTITLY